VLEAACYVLKSDSALRTRFGIGLLSEDRVPPGQFSHLHLPNAGKGEGKARSSEGLVVPSAHPLLQQLHLAAVRLQMAKARELGPYYSEPFASFGPAAPPPGDVDALGIMRVFTPPASSLPPPKLSSSQSSHGLGTFFSLFASSRFEEVVHYQVMSLLGEQFKDHKEKLSFEPIKHYITAGGIKADCALIPLPLPAHGSGSGSNKRSSNNKKGILIEYDGNEVHENDSLQRNQNLIAIGALASATSQLCTALSSVLPYTMAETIMARVTCSNARGAGSTLDKDLKPSKEAITAAYQKATVSVPLSLVVGSQGQTNNDDDKDTTMVTVALHEWAGQASVERWLIKLHARLQAQSVRIALSCERMLTPTPSLESAKTAIERFYLPAAQSPPQSADGSSADADSSNKADDIDICTLCGGVASCGGGTSNDKDKDLLCKLPLNEYELVSLTNALNKKAFAMIAARKKDLEQGQGTSSSTTPTTPNPFTASSASNKTSLRDETSKVAGYSVVTITSEEWQRWCGVTSMTPGSWPPPGKIQLSEEGKKEILRRLTEAGLELPTTTTATAAAVAPASAQ
jgi:hypothetical protein